MPLPTKYNQITTLADAGKYARNFRQANPSASRSAGFFKEYVEQVIDQAGCVAMRCYYVQKDDGSPAVVLVGVDADGNDMTGGVLAELPWLCPPWCPATNPLNS